MHPSASSKSKSRGSFDRSLWRRLLAARAMYSCLGGRLGHGTSCKSSKRTSSTMADAGLNTSAAALAFTLAVMRADNAAPNSAGWLWRLEPI